MLDFRDYQQFSAKKLAYTLLYSLYSILETFQNSNNISSGHVLKLETIQLKHTIEETANRKTGDFRAQKDEIFLSLLFITNNKPKTPKEKNIKVKN